MLIKNILTKQKKNEMVWGCMRAERICVIIFVVIVFIVIVIVIVIVTIINR